MNEVEPGDIEIFYAHPRCGGSIAVASEPDGNRCSIVLTDADVSHFVRMPLEIDEVDELTKALREWMKQEKKS